MFNGKKERKTNLITQVPDVGDVLLRHFCSHGDLGSQFDLGLDFLGEDVGQVGASHVRAVAWETQDKIAYSGIKSRLCSYAS